MIFVTVGTHEQQFNRLISQVDELVRKQIIKERVVQQIGYSDYIPKHTEYSMFFDYEDMKSLEEEADIIITHGGPATFMSVISAGKIPIVVPRQLKYGEHVNDHQLEFALKVQKKGYPIEVIEDILQLENFLNESKEKYTGVNQFSHNEEFVKSLCEQIDKLLE